MSVYKDTRTTKDGRAYYYKFNYKDVMGVSHTYKSKKYSSKKEATQQEALQRIRLNDVSSGNTVALNEVFIKYCSYRENELKPQSIVKLKNQYKYIECIGSIKINELNYKHIEFMKSKLIGSNDYKNKVINLLVRLLKFSNKYYGTKLDIIKFCDRIKSNKEFKKEMDFYTLDEFNRFLSVIDNQEWELFFKMLFYLGFRKGELQALTWDDIDFENETVSISKTLTTKLKGIEYFISTPKTHNSIRILPIPKSVLECLKQHKNNESKFKDFSNSWFVFGGPIPYKESTIFIHKDQYCKLANLRSIRIHDFRHSTASLLIHSGASIQLVSKYLGHASIDITLKTYTHLYKSELDNIKVLIDKLG